ncbi:MAG: hypothetical protein SOZ58_12620 [Prevotella sp.]|nr:hypothetical protein [Prevotella sp.]
MKSIIKKIGLFAFATALLAAPMLSRAQTATEIAQQVMNSDEYLYGEGYGATVNSADKQALANLTSKISVNISSTFNITESEINTDEGFTSETMAKSIVNSYSQASLNNTQSIVLSNDPEVHVMRYVKKSEVSKIFEQRKDKVFDFLRSAVKSERRTKIDDALRYYYWAFNLLKSLQYPNEVTFRDDSGTHLLSTWIPEQINRLLEGLKTDVASRDGNVLNLYITYQGKPVASVDYTYFDGLQWSPIYSCKDGIGTIELRPNSSLQNINMKYEYEYADEAHIDKEIAAVMQMFRGTAFRKASATVSATSVSSAANSPLNASGSSSTASTDIQKEFERMIKNEADINTAKATDDQAMAQIMGEVIAAIKAGDTQPIQKYFTADGWDMYLKLLHYGKAKVIGNPQFSFYKLGQDVICRSIPMSFSFSNNRRKFVEAVTFTFNKDKMIDAVAFGLGNEAKTDIFNRGASANWSEESRMILASFLENYKTAFALKRLDYIESIFDDNAVIITGHVVKKAEKNLETGKYIENEHVRYNRVSKADYIKNLRMCFDSNEFINIKFTDNDIMKMGQGGELYGIQIHQDYYSSSYGDTGYLFLLVDINNPKEPTIYVRTWQPERDPNVNNRLPKDHPDYGIYGSGNF